MRQPKKDKKIVPKGRDFCMRCKQQCEDTVAVMGRRDVIWICYGCYKKMR